MAVFISCLEPHWDAAAARSVLLEKPSLDGVEAPYAALDTVEVNSGIGLEAIEAPGVDCGAPGSGLSSYSVERSSVEHKGDVAAARSVLLEKPGRDDAIAPNAGYGCANRGFSNAGRGRIGGGHGLSSYAASESLRFI